MGLETVIEEVLGRGRVEAEEIRKAAGGDRDRLLAEERLEGERFMSARVRDATIKAERTRIQDLARAELESKKIILAAQKEVLDEVYSRSLQALSSLPDRNEIVRALLNANAANWRAGKVYASPGDADNVRAVAGPNFAGTIDSLGGVVIESGDGTRRNDLRFEALFSDVWRDSVREVAEILWPSK